VHARCRRRGRDVARAGDCEQRRRLPRGGAVRGDVGRRRGDADEHRQAFALGQLEGRLLALRDDRSVDRRGDDHVHVPVAAMRGRTSSPYTVVDADVGSSLMVVVTAKNASGSASASSARTATVTVGPPVTTGTRPASTKAPAIAGTAAKGAKLTVKAGTWTGA